MRKVREKFYRELSTQLLRGKSEEQIEEALQRLLDTPGAIVWVADTLLLQEPRQPVLLRTTHALEIQAHTGLKLYKDGITRVGELIALTATQVRAIPGINDKDFGDIAIALKDRGLKFKQE